MPKIKQHQLKEMKDCGFLDYMTEDTLTLMNLEMFEEDFDPSDIILF